MQIHTATHKQAMSIAVSELFAASKDAYLIAKTEHAVLVKRLGGLGALGLVARELVVLEVDHRELDHGLCVCVCWTR